MSTLWTNKFTLTGLQLIGLGKAFLKYRNPRRRKFGQQLDAFNERAWREAAEKLGASFESLGSSIHEIVLDGTRTRVIDNVSAIDDPVTLAVMHNKPLTHRILSEQSLSVPRHASFTLNDMRPATNFLATCTRDCVVKPASGTGGGRGVTTGISKTSHLARAAAAAAVYGDDLMIEEQITGDNYRLLYLDGELIDAYVRKLPGVYGDGRSTVAQLVKNHNEERMRGGVSQVLLGVDLDMKRTLARQGLSLRSVPPAGTSVTLKTVVNENTGSDNETVTNRIHPSIVEDGSRGVRTLGARFAGIDIVTRDITVPLAESRGVILEVNGTPNLYYHYHKRDGCFAAAVPLLRRLLLPTDSRNVDDSAPANAPRHHGSLVHSL